MSNCIFKSRRLSLRYFGYVNTLFGGLLSQNIENQQITSAKFTVKCYMYVKIGVRRLLAGRLCTKNNLEQQRCLVVLRLLLIAS